jgi:myo-inositol-1(or 4)-monophosphatase
MNTCQPTQHPRQHPTLTPADLTRDLATAEAIARRAGELIRARWRLPLETATKASAADLVTALDLATEALIRDLLGDLAPGDAILGEEQGGPRGIDERCWYVDPIDGTTNMAHGLDYFAVSIALLCDGLPAAAVVYNPIRDQLFRAAYGQGAALNGAPLRVSQTAALPQALLATGFPTTRRDDPDHNNIRHFTALARVAQGIRRPGSAALDLAGVAAGWFDAFWEPNLQPWDTAAGWLLVQEAGGAVSTFSGAPFSPHIPQCLATNAHLHPAMLAALNLA